MSLLPSQPAEVQLRTIQEACKFEDCRNTRLDANKKAPFDGILLTHAMNSVLLNFATRCEENANFWVAQAEEHQRTLCDIRMDKQRQDAEDRFMFSKRELDRWQKIAAEQQAEIDRPFFLRQEFWLGAIIGTAVTTAAVVFVAAQ